MEQSSSSAVDWSELPFDHLLRVFAFFTPLQACVISSVCHSFYELGSLNEVWRPHCQRLSLPESEPAKDCYKKWFQEFKTSEAPYLQMKDIYNRLKTWAEKASVQFDFLPPASPQGLEEVEATLSSLLGQKFTFPDDVRCWYLMTGGQPFNATHGLFGGYSFYHTNVNILNFPLPQMATFLSRGKHKLVPIGVAQQKCYYLVPFDGAVTSLPTAKKGTIVEVSAANVIEWKVATSFGALLSSRLNGYESGCYPVLPRLISLFSNNGPTAITNGVKITASPLFIPENSSKLADKYFWAYSVTMSMDKDEPKENSCQLTTRHWEIRAQNAEAEYVNGPGVVGHFPEMYPGAFFRYESCCPLDTPTGRMGGSFQMKKQDQSVFDAVVPTWDFVIPPVIQDSENK